MVINGSNFKIFEKNKIGLKNKILVNEKNQFKKLFFQLLQKLNRQIYLFAKIIRNYLKTRAFTPRPALPLAGFTQAKSCAAAVRPWNGSLHKHPG